MQLDIRGPGVHLTPELIRHTERRVRFALSRFGSRISWVRVCLSDLNGPKGGIDRCCRMSAKVRGADRLVIEDRDPNVLAAIHRAADRLGLRVGRQLARGCSDRSYSRSAVEWSTGKDGRTHAT